MNSPVKKQVHVMGPSNRTWKGVQCRMLTSFFDRIMRDNLRLSRVVSSFLAAIAQM
jgi:hypothetical protein